MNFLTTPLVALLLLFSTVSIAQVPSFCSGPASLQETYEADAWYVAHEYLLQADSAKWANTAFIPENVKDSVLDVLLGVYNADLIERDSVIDLYNIHKFKEVDLQRFDMFMDTSHAWVRSFLDGNTVNTGNVFIDSIANVFGFEVELLTWMPEWVLTHDAQVRIKCNTYINTDFLARAMVSYSGVTFASPYNLGGDGNQIYYQPRDGFVEVTFRRGWGDCPGGCLYQRDWLFRVYDDDCSVQFISSYGDPVASSSIFAPAVNNEDIVVFPNPTRDFLQLNIKKLHTNNLVWAQIQDINGQTQAEYNLPVFDGNVHEQLNVEALKPGTYFLTVWENGLPIRRKSIVKM